MTHPDPLKQQIEEARRQAEAILSLTKRPQPSPSPGAQQEPPHSANDNPVAAVKELNENITWLRNAGNRLSGFFNSCARKGRYVWDHGLGGTLGFAGRVAAKIGTGYAALFNRVSHVTDKKTGQKKFSKMRAAFAVAATLAVGSSIFYGGGFFAGIAYDTTTRLVSEEKETLWIYNATPVEGDHYEWWISASDNPNVMTGEQQMLLLAPNYAYLRFPAETERLAAMVTQAPTKAEVTLTGWRMRVPPFGWIDIHRKIQDIRYLEQQDIPGAPSLD